jgi:hypothetical protein
MPSTRAVTNDKFFKLLGLHQSVVGSFRNMTVEATRHLLSSTKPWLISSGLVSCAQRLEIAIAFGGRGDECLRGHRLKMIDQSLE